MNLDLQEGLSNKPAVILGLGSKSRRILWTPVDRIDWEFFLERESEVSRDVN